MMIIICLLLTHGMSEEKKQKKKKLCYGDFYAYVQLFSSLSIVQPIFYSLGLRPSNCYFL